MYSYPDQQAVLDDLGDKFLDSYLKAVDIARADLDDFREFRPEWFVNFSKRFVANFIHERLWDGMTRGVADHDDVTIVDKEPVRQIIFDSKYLMRFKRHKKDLKIASYPTSGALAFWTNRAEPLPGMDLNSLALGYIWDVDTGEIGDAILSFRDGKDNPIWSVSLHPGQAGGATGITHTDIDPKLPQIDLSDVLNEDDETSEGQ